MEHAWLQLTKVTYCSNKFNNFPRMRKYMKKSYKIRLTTKMLLCKAFCLPNLLFHSLSVHSNHLHLPLNIKVLDYGMI